MFGDGVTLHDPKVPHIPYWWIAANRLKNANLAFADAVHVS